MSRSKFWARAMFSPCSVHKSLLNFRRFAHPNRFTIDDHLGWRVDNRQTPAPLPKAASWLFMKGPFRIRVWDEFIWPGSFVDAIVGTGCFIAEVSSHLKVPIDHSGHERTDLRVGTGATRISPEQGHHFDFDSYAYPQKLSDEHVLRSSSVIISSADILSVQFTIAYSPSTRVYATRSSCPAWKNWPPETPTNYFYSSGHFIKL